MLGARCFFGVGFRCALPYAGGGRNDTDEEEDEGRGKGWEPTAAERWLAPILNYQPA